MENYGFTETQLSKIYKLIEQLHKTNTDLASDRKVEGISFYTNKRRNFMCSYVVLSYTNGNFNSQYNCKIIEPDGTEIDGLEYFGDEIECVNYLQKCQKISFN